MGKRDQWISNVAQRKRTAWVPSREKAGQIARSSVPYGSPQGVFRGSHAKAAQIREFLAGFSSVAETGDSLAEGAGFELRVRFLANCDAKGARESGSICGICGKR
jgi:hypothetical protein